MSNYDLTPAPSLILKTDEQIRAYTNPTRITILAALAQEKQSVSRVARQLDVHPANLTHHFKLLEKAGLIRLVEKRETGKNLEKLYRAVAYQFSIDPGEGTANKQVLALTILRDNLNAAIQSLKYQKEEKDVLGVLRTVQISPRDLVKFEKKLVKLAEEFSKNAAKTGTFYSLNASLYPTEAGGAPAQEIAIQIEE